MLFPAIAFCFVQCGFRGRRSVESAVEFALDIYSTLMFFIGCSLYVLAYYVTVLARRSHPHSIPIFYDDMLFIVYGVCVLIQLYRFLELLSVWIELHLTQHYQPRVAARAFVNTGFHYLEYVVFFGTIYVGLSGWGFDKSLTAFDSFGGKGFVESNNIGPNELIAPLYFSFITMATVGYGDYHPKSFLGRAAVCIQVLVGIVLLAVVVVRAVTASMTEQPSRNNRRR